MPLYDLVFEGGGAKGMAFAGALEVFSNAGHTHRRIVGTSAGAITAMLIGAGYTPAELTAACTELDPQTGKPVFATFMDAPARTDFSPDMVDNCETMKLLRAAGFVLPGLALAEEAIIGLLLRLELYRELFSFNECGGFYSGDAALNWIRKRLAQKGMAPDISWSKFALTTGSDVSVVTTNVTAKEMTVLNARTAPDCPVAESVRMSMSIPFVWREMIWQAAWGKYRGRDLTADPNDPKIYNPNIFVDGGVLSNFPLRLVTDSTPNVTAIMGATDPNGANTLGLYLDGKTPVPGAKVSDTVRPRLRLADRVTNLIDTLTDSNDLAVMRDYEKNICKLPVGGYGTTEFRMSPERQALLIDSGRTAMKAYLRI